MANTKSAKKAVRKISKSTEVNKARRTRMRTEVRKVEEAIQAGDKSAAVAALKDVEPVLASCISAPRAVRCRVSRRASAQWPTNYPCLRITAGRAEHFVCDLFATIKCSD